MTPLLIGLGFVALLTAARFLMDDHMRRAYEKQAARQLAEPPSNCRVIR